MTPLPPPLGRGEIIFWRIDAQRYAADWHRGEGSFRVGGRWNSPGRRVVYAALDPATAILEVAVHKGFAALDTTPHILTSGRIIDPGRIRVVAPEEIPNPNWLTPAAPNANQQSFGDGLLRDHAFVLIPSTVSSHSWNLIFEANMGASGYDRLRQSRFALDPRLQPRNG